MKIGICFEGRNLENIDYRFPEEGNPGVGGTTWLQILLAYYLSKSKLYKIVLYTVEKQIFPDTLLQKTVKNDCEAVQEAFQDGIDIFIFIAGRKKTDFYKEIRKYDLVSIAWAHNYLDFITLKQLSISKSIRRIIFVGQQLYDSYIDDVIIKKSSFIYNIVPPVNSDLTKKYNGKLGVAYVGALIPAKGFHKLARQWKRIVKQVPQAHLHVIGSGMLYNHNLKTGKMNITEEKYEQLLMRYLSDKKGQLLPSVTFYGRLGKEKYNVFSNVAVGVPNPTGKTETFCLSAVEMEQLGIPIITYKGYGLLDTVSSQNGILIKNGKQLRNAIVKILKDKELREAYGKFGVEYSKQFEPEIIIELWKKELDAVYYNKECINLFSHNFMNNDMKWIKWIYANSKDSIKIFNGFPSINYTISFLKFTVKKFSNWSKSCLKLFMLFLY